MLLNLLAVGVFAVDFWLLMSRPAGDKLPIIHSVVGVVLITITGYLGGEMVYVRGVAVKEPPDQSL